MKEIRKKKCKTETKKKDWREEGGKNTPP